MRKMSRIIKQDLFDKLSEMYIKDTKNSEGMKFCGCRPDECSDYTNMDECKICLMKHINEQV